jgi:putative iron-dependent peroxidase
MFVGFSQDRDRLEAMLQSMAGIGGGQRDRLTNFTRALTGAYYFFPSSEGLAEFAASE